MEEPTTTISVSGMPISLLSDVDELAKKSPMRDRSKFIVASLQAIVKRANKKGAGRRAEVAGK